MAHNTFCETERMLLISTLTRDQKRAILQECRAAREAGWEPNDNTIAQWMHNELRVE